jgi:hypothetical protein
MFFHKSGLLERCDSSCVDHLSITLFQPGTNIWPTTKETYTLDLEQTTKPFETIQNNYKITEFTRYKK